MENMVHTIGDVFAAVMLGGFMGNLADTCSSEYPKLMNYPTEYVYTSTLDDEIKTAFMNGWKKGVAVVQQKSCSELIVFFKLNVDDLEKFK